MKRSSAFLVILGLVSMGQGQPGQKMEIKKPCEPWPACQIVKSPLQPGSPTTGLNAVYKGEGSEGVLAKDYKPEVMRTPKVF